MRTLYRDFTSSAEIDAQYDVDRTVADYGAYALHYAETSRVTRQRLRHERDVPYGATPAETLDIFPAARAAAPVFVFLHGGYWRSLSSKEFSCVALGLHELGITTVVVDYALAPRVGLDEITRQARSALYWVLGRIGDHGGDPQRVVIGGHSAGAQLGAMCLQTAWDEDFGLRADPLSGAVLVSGVYDLQPLQFSDLQPQLQLTGEIITRCSPMCCIRPCKSPILVTWGGAESDEFRRQSEDYVSAWRLAGNRARRLPQPGRNHFDAIYGFEDPASELCQWIAAATSAKPRGGA